VSFIYESKYTQSIPEIKSVSGWKQVLIVECGEKLICLDDIEPKLITVRSEYYLQGYEGSLSKCYAREKVAKKLILAARELPNGIKFVIFDAWRPFMVQQALFNKHYNELKYQNSGLDEKHLSN